MSDPALLLQEQIERAEILDKYSNYSPQYTIWCDTTLQIIEANFNVRYKEMFERAGKSYAIFLDEYEARADFLNEVNKKVEMLKTIIEEYKRFQSSRAVDISRSTPLDTYDFHIEIKAVSLRLFEDKHYAQSVEEAFKRVVREVKRIVKEKTGQVYDGDDLMNKAFSPQNPIIKFNQFRSIEDKDEQKGIMFLFKGIVGIRNKKAHDNVILNDPIRAIEYLNLASLLMRLLEQFSN